MCLKFSLILIVAIPRTTTKLDDIGIFKRAAEVLGMFLDNGFAMERFLSGKGSAFRQTYLGAILLCFSHSLTNT